jgi:hypothetical protein
MTVTGDELRPRLRNVREIGRGTGFSPGHVNSPTLPHFFEDGATVVDLSVPGGQKL